MAFAGTVARACLERFTSNSDRNYSMSTERGTVHVETSALAASFLDILAPRKVVLITTALISMSVLVLATTVLRQPIHELDVAGIITFAELLLLLLMSVL